MNTTGGAVEVRGGGGGGGGKGGGWGEGELKGRAVVASIKFRQLRTNVLSSISYSKWSLKHVQVHKHVQRVCASSPQRIGILSSLKPVCCLMALKNRVSTSTEVVRCEHR